MTKDELKRRYQPLMVGMGGSNEKRHESAEIELQTAEYLAKGGKIERFGCGESREVSCWNRNMAEV